MQRLHEWKADMLTLRDLGIMRQRHARMPKHKTDVRTKNGIGYLQKSAEVIVSWQRALQTGEDSQKDEGLNVRMVK
jgi:hypothetical protein